MNVGAAGGPRELYEESAPPPREPLFLPQAQQRARDRAAQQEALFSLGAVPIASQTLPGGHQIHIFLGPGPPPSAFFQPPAIAHSSHGTAAPGVGNGGDISTGPGMGLLPTTSAGTSLSSTSRGSGWMPDRAAEPLFGRVYPSHQMMGPRGVGTTLPSAFDTAGRGVSGSGVQSHAQHSAQGPGPPALMNSRVGNSTGTGAGVGRLGSPHPRLRMATHPAATDTRPNLMPAPAAAEAPFGYLPQALVPARTSSSPAAVVVPGVDDHRWAQQQQQQQQQQQRQPPFALLPLPAVPAVSSANTYSAGGSQFPGALFPQAHGLPFPVAEPAGPPGGSPFLPHTSLSGAGLAPAGISQDGAGDSSTFFSADSLPFNSRERLSGTSNNWTGSASFGPRTTEGGAPPVPAPLTPATAAALARVGSAPPSMYVSRLPNGVRLPGYNYGVGMPGYGPWGPSGTPPPVGAPGMGPGQRPPQHAPSAQAAVTSHGSAQAGVPAAGSQVVDRCPYMSSSSHSQQVRADEVTQTHRGPSSSTAPAQEYDGANSDDDAGAAPQGGQQQRGGRLARFFHAAANTIRSALGMPSGPQAQRGSTVSSIPTLSDNSGSTTGAGPRSSRSHSQQHTPAAAPLAAGATGRSSGGSRPVTALRSPFAAGGAQVPAAGPSSIQQGGAGFFNPAAQRTSAATHIPNYRSPSSTTDAASLVQLLSRRVVGTRAASAGALHPAGSGSDSGGGPVLRRRIPLGASRAAAGAGSVETSSTTSTGGLGAPPRAPGAPYRSALASQDATDQSLDSALINAIANMLRALETRLGGAEGGASGSGGSGPGPGSGPPAIQITSLPLLSTRRWTSSTAPGLDPNDPLAGLGPLPAWAQRFSPRVTAEDGPASQPVPGLAVGAPSRTADEEVAAESNVDGSDSGSDSGSEAGSVVNATPPVGMVAAPAHSEEESSHSSAHSPASCSSTTSSPHSAASSLGSSSSQGSGGSGPQATFPLPDVQSATPDAGTSGTSSREPGSSLASAGRAALLAAAALQLGDALQSAQSPAYEEGGEGEGSEGESASGSCHQDCQDGEACSTDVGGDELSNLVAEPHAPRQLLQQDQYGRQQASEAASQTPTTSHHSHRAIAASDPAEEQRLNCHYSVGSDEGYGEGEEEVGSSTRSSNVSCDTSTFAPDAFGQLQHRDLSLPSNSSPGAETSGAPVVPDAWDWRETGTLDLDHVTEDFENEEGEGEGEGDEELSIGWEVGSSASDYNCISTQQQLDQQQGEGSHGSAQLVPTGSGAESSHVPHPHPLPSSLVPLPMLAAAHPAVPSTSQLPALSGWDQGTAGTEAATGSGSSGGTTSLPFPQHPVRTTRLNAVYQPQGLDPELLRQLQQGAAAASHLAAAGDHTGSPGFGNEGQLAMLQGGLPGIPADEPLRSGLSSMDTPGHNDSFSMPSTAPSPRQDLGFQTVPVAPPDAVPFTFPSLLQPVDPPAAGGSHAAPPRRASSSGLMVPQPGLTYLYNTVPTFPVSVGAHAAAPAHHPLSPDLLAQHTREHHAYSLGERGTGHTGPSDKQDWRRTLSGCSGYSTDASSGAFAGSPLQAVVRAEGWLEALAGSLKGVDPSHDHVVQQISLIRLHYAGVCLSGCV